MNKFNLLNENQKKIVETTEGPVLVLAGAGSGKTRSLIYRTAYLIDEKGLNPWNILVVTFTNKAARELKYRLEKTLNFSTYSLWIGTFHSICSRILRYEQYYLPFSSNYSIFDEVDQKSVFKRIYKELKIDDRKFPLNKVRNIISKQKNSLILPKDFFEFNSNNYFTETVFDIYSHYQDFLQKNNSLDFDDLLLYTAILLHDNPEIRKKYEQKFQYVMIDEYQDTNYAQFKIVNFFAKNHQNLCVVGDDDQAIYSWRGADIKNILSFEKDYRNVTTIKLEQNYRSPQQVLDVANCLIENNTERHSKKLFTEIRSDHKPKVVVHENEINEADFVAREVSKLKIQNPDLNEFVILYRTNAQSRVFERAFAQNGIKYQIVGGVNFYQRKEIKDILAYLHILDNPQDSESLLRVINFPPRGIGKNSLGQFLEYASKLDLSLYDSLKKFTKDEIINPILKKKFTRFTELIESWKSCAPELTVKELVTKILDKLELLRHYENSNDPKDIARNENIREFVAAIAEFSEAFERENADEPKLTDYLQNISLQTDMDNLDETESSVKLMTMHNAKGLEFDNVFIVGLEEGLLPHSRSLENKREFEEERRLLYVAITRAKKIVYLNYAKTRRTYETVNNTIPSRFLMEIDDKLLDKSFFLFDRYRPTGKILKQKKNVVLESQKHFKVGQKIAHNKFGEGIVLNVDGIGNDAKLTISFQNGNLKKIIGNFVRKI